MGIENIFIINNYNKKIRDFYIYKISQIEGIYNKQIARILGISERNLMRIIKNVKANINNVELNGIGCPKSDNLGEKEPVPKSDKHGRKEPVP